MSFLFFFKRKPHIVDCFTAHGSAYEFAKPKKGTAFFPDWWKALPKLESYTVQNFKPATNMRHCTGMIELFRNSFVLPMWCDASIIVGPQCSPGFAYQYADERSRMDEHPAQQYEGFISPIKYQHLKLESPWVFATKKSFNWAVVPPLYNSQHAGGYTALPGVVDLRYVRATNVQLILPRDPTVPKKVALNLNDPLLMYIPMTETAVEYRHHLISQDEFAAMNPPALKFNGSGMTLRRLRKSADAAQRCPFGN